MYKRYIGSIIEVGNEEVVLMEKSKKILTEALELSPIERASLVEDLLSSFNFPERKENDTIWAREVEERINAYEQGEIYSSPAEDVFKRIDRNIGK